MHITIITFGKIKNEETRNLSKYYIKLCGKYSVINQIALKDPGEQKVNTVDLLKHKITDYILLDAQGKNYTTEEFSCFLKTKEQITFLVGNAFGFEECVKKGARGTLSLSRMTMNHELALVVLTEQLFRCLNLLSGGKYHK